MALRSRALSDTECLRATVGRVSERPEQQGHVIMRFAGDGLEHDDDLRVERGDALRLEIVARVKDKAVDSGPQLDAFGHQIPLSTVRVGLATTDDAPLAA